MSIKKSEEKTESKQEFKQPEINIGMVGHVDHGKTTLLLKLSGKWTSTHSEELKKGITIRLGYADSNFYKCPKHNYSAIKPCCKEAKLTRAVSFVDAPGHETLMATMLSGAAIMDGAILLIAADEDCPQPQTKEHLMALELIGIKNIVIVQNKIDLVTKEDAIKNYAQIKEFIKGTIAENAPIIPVSAIYNINIDFLIEAIENTIKTPKRDLTKDPIMFIARSFDINKPGSEISKLSGGVLGGALKQGILKLKDKIEIKPGRKIDHKDKILYKTIETEITGIKSASHSVKEINPGGSFGILTSLDPFLVKSDSLAGNIAGLPGKLPPLWDELSIEPKLLKKVVGTKEDINVDPIKKSEPLMLIVNATATSGVVIEISKNLFKIRLKRPVCAEKNSKVAISRLIGSRWRLIGIGIIK